MTDSYEDAKRKAFEAYREHVDHVAEECDCWHDGYEKGHARAVRRLRFLFDDGYGVNAAFDSLEREAKDPLQGCICTLDSGADGEPCSQPVADGSMYCAYCRDGHPRRNPRQYPPAEH